MLDTDDKTDTEVDSIAKSVGFEISVLVSVKFLDAEVVVFTISSAFSEALSVELCADSDEISF